jgi:hypothetical protein
MHVKLLKAQEEAKFANAGALATAGKNMRDKANEGTAPKGKKGQ